MPYRCLDDSCGHQEQVMPIDECCPVCWREMVEFDSEGPVATAESGVVRRIGLCTIVCDVSISMKHPVPEMSSSLHAGSGACPSRLELVAHNAAFGIWDLCQGLSKAEDAYIALICFGEDAGVMQFPSGDCSFVASAASIRNQFQTGEALERYLLDSFEQWIGRIGKKTNMSAGIEKARALYDALQSGDLSRYGIPQKVCALEHDLLSYDGNEQVVPNSRVLIYSDGRHNHGPLVNAFADSEAARRSDLPWATLMTAFIGSAEDPGAVQVKELAGDCPQHNCRNFFLINSPLRFQKLRGLFRMASGASGFCPKCLAEQT